ncbi:ubiquitin-conjugating enzyme E2-17 kDa-like isoform X1 [Haliotis rufescens]|uniref:ubiquitin-conjugating enzyme E2-17 kDa-like isoform X1 n=1 Tax=Haliotis rufescens TaxID=6454 RepID=UPI00201EA70F|nr:ubiquitin-conjugating enzyme E2-17 kDa-like isoform X1 [Haliotis rufescens]
MALKRIFKEWQDTLEHPMEGIAVGPFGDDCFHWEAIILGPAGTSYEGGTFKLEVTFPINYPFKPPKVCFKTRVYHPNISSAGCLNLDILREAWSPALTVAKILMCVRYMLVDGINPDDPLEPDIARLFKTDRAKYEQTVREWTKKYAM